MEGVQLLSSMRDIMTMLISIMWPFLNLFPVQRSQSKCSQRRSWKKVNDTQNHVHTP